MTGAHFSCEQTPVPVKAHQPETESVSDRSGSDEIIDPSSLLPPVTKYVTAKKCTHLY